MKVNVSRNNAPAVLQQFAKWLPAYGEKFERLEKSAYMGVSVEIKAIRPRRSTPQNDMYWALVTALASEVGMTKGQMHEEVLCEKHGYDLVEFRGEVRKVPKGRSHNLTTVDFSELLEIVQQWCAEQGVQAA